MITFDRQIYKIVDDVAELIYKTASKFSSDDHYGLSTQMRHTAVTLTTSVAESCVAVKSEDVLAALEKAYSSLRSLQYQIGLALRLGYIDQRRHDVCDRKAGEVNNALTMQIGSFNASLRNTNQSSAVTPQRPQILPAPCR